MPQVTKPSLATKFKKYLTVSKKTKPLLYQKINYLAKMDNRRLLETFQTLETLNNPFFQHVNHSELWYLYEELKPLIPTSLFELTNDELIILDLLRLAHNKNKTISI